MMICGCSQIHEIQIVEKSLNLNLGNGYKVKEVNSYVDEFNFGKRWKVIKVILIYKESAKAEVETQIQRSKYFEVPFFDNGEIDSVDYKPIQEFTNYYLEKRQINKSVNYQEEFQDYEKNFLIGNWSRLSSDEYEFHTFNVEDLDGIRITALFNRTTGQLEYTWYPPL